MLQSVNVGDIIVKQVGWSMIIYEFYKILRTTKTQMILMPMMKNVYYDEKHDDFHPIVKPVDMGLPDSELVRCSKKAFDYCEYDPNYEYVEDHLD